MKWIDLFQFLNKTANDMKNIGKFNWQSEVLIYDASTGEEYTCDTYYVRSNDQPILMINLDKTTSEENN
jgi:hypothetical protein